MKKTNNVLIIVIIVAAIFVFMNVKPQEQSIIGCVSSANQDCDTIRASHGLIGTFYVYGKSTTSCQTPSKYLCTTYTQGSATCDTSFSFIKTCLATEECDEYIYTCSGNTNLYEVDCADIVGIVGSCDSGSVCTGGQRIYTSKPSISTVKNDICYSTSCDEYVYTCSGNTNLYEVDCGSIVGVIGSCNTGDTCTGRTRTYNTKPSLMTVQADICESLCTPQCPDPSTVTCGQAINPSNGCGTCSGYGTKCTSGTCVSGQCQTLSKPFEITSFTINKNAVKENEAVTATITIKNNQASCNKPPSDSSSNCNYGVEFGLYAKRLPYTQQPAPPYLMAVGGEWNCGSATWTKSKEVYMNAGDSTTVSITVTSPNRNTFDNTLYAFDTQLVPTAIVYKECGNSATFSDYRVKAYLPLTCDNPGTESCNGKDDDCDGSIDENVCGGTPGNGTISDSYCKSLSTCAEKGLCFANEKKTKCESQCAFFQKWKSSEYDGSDPDTGCVFNSTFGIIAGVLMVALVFMKKSK